MPFACFCTDILVYLIIFSTSFIYFGPSASCSCGKYLRVFFRFDFIYYEVLWRTQFNLDVYISHIPL